MIQMTFSNPKTGLNTPNPSTAPSTSLTPPPPPSSGKIILRPSFKKIRGLNYDDFWQSTALYNVLMGSKRSKKSLTTALKVISLILQNPKNNVLALRRVFIDHRKSTFPSLVWAIAQICTDPTTGIDYSRMYWEISSEKSKDLYIIYKKTRQAVLFHSLDNNQRINSLSAFKGSLNICWIEEAFEIESKEAFETLTSSVTQGDASYKRFYLTFNPFLETSWLKSYFFDKTPQEKKEQSIFTKITTYKDNEFLGEDDLHTFENIKKNNPRLYKIIGLANWGAAEGAVFTNFHVATFKTEDLDNLVKQSASSARFMLPQTKKELLFNGTPRFLHHYGMDYGFSNHPSTLIKVTEDRKYKTLYVHAPYFYRTHMSNEEIANTIISLGLEKAIIYTDRSEPKTNAYLQTRGILNLRKQNYKSIEEGIRRMLNYKIIIQKHSLSKPVIEEFTNYRYLYDNKRDEITAKVDGRSADHAIDAVRYSLCDVLRADVFTLL